MNNSSMIVHSPPSSTSPAEASIMKPPTNARIKMQPEVYEAAESGSVDQLWVFDNWKQEKTATGNNVLHVHIGMPLMIRRGVLTLPHHLNMSFIRHVIDETSQNSAVLQSNDKGDTPLHFAARFGHTDAVKMLLTRPELVNAGLLDKANNAKDTALHDATRAGHADIIMLLVEAGEENSLHLMPNNLGETPLFLAAERGCFKSFIAIVGHTSLATLEHKGPCGQTALHLAVLWGNQDIVDRILEIDTSSLLIRVKNDQGQTPLHCCAAQNVKEQRMILRALLDQDDKYNSAAYIQDNEGRTPLRIATLNSNFNGAKILIRSYPDCIEIVDNKGQNMVHLAANLGCIDKFRLFLRKAPKCDKLINEKDDEGNTPLHLLVATAPYLSITGVKFLLTRQRNLDVRAFNNKNLTAGDIIAAKDGLLPLDASTRNRRTSLIPEGKRIIPDVSKTEVAETTNTMNNNVVLQNKGSSEIEDRISRYKKMEETHLVVAALIATVSFAAAFTLPGGFDQSPGENIGLALLAKKTSFMVFLVSDTIAFTMSSIAVICYFSMASRSKSKSNLKGVETLSMVAYAFTTISLGALMLTFVTGVYTMVSRSSGLTSTVIVISLYYFILYLGLCVGSWRALWACSQRF